MFTITRRLVRLTFVLPVALIAAATTAVPVAASDPLPEIHVSGELPTGWLSGGEYPITATVTSPVNFFGYAWSLRTPKRALDCGEPFKIDACPNPVSSTYVLRPAQLPDGAYDLVFSVESLVQRPAPGQPS